ncbi:MAG: helix-hairpin-helix domain-containing protein [Trichodesmium sp. St2_bin6]|nr:helix-hairpin-helix domain-containing protein [Trichodesmium sp. St4_bin8_1]MDE5072702.1 helix-hairpin-helix domain-containing protein [Trichodesmium sp. St5_bin8]MDE5077671.1 helix-hairpin-helix domain-containing protein [Trichodesmium sp. St2_bin6]MDE5091723.1 helix-hairpin-helix domain-containing protein [Trichodesmium sp. St18_bin3_1_1]MDE5102999.1 helix-hairpin-helix domain-containing protein [Trichodesmium sp. St19_bin2]
MINYFHFLSLSGIVASLIAISSCASTITPNTTPNTSPTSNSTVSIAPGATIKIDINDASDSDLKKLAIKLNVPDLPEKIKESRPYKDINELAIKKVMSPKQLDFVKNDITVVTPQQ